MYITDIIMILYPLDITLDHHWEAPGTQDSWGEDGDDEEDDTEEVTECDHLEPIWMNLRVLRLRPSKHPSDKFQGRWKLK